MSFDVNKTKSICFEIAMFLPPFLLYYIDMKTKRIAPGFYSIGKLHIVEKDDSGWRVLRFPDEKSSQPEEIYQFDYYADARDHAIMEASIMELLND